MNTKFLILRSIYENSLISQRELSRKFCISLGKINLIMKELLDEGTLIKKDNFDNKIGAYEITNSGKDYVKKYKVDGALILACGMGLRLAPLTYDTPKSFIKIKNERMIERQIEQLKSVGIEDITIMVGFMKEKFDYLIDKYNVKLIYNREYKDKNTLSTLYHAIDILKNKNMYICVADVYMEENIFHTYESEPYYIGAFYEDCKNEWRYIYNSKNEIKGVEVGGKNDYCLVGPCFLTKEFLEKFLPMIKDYYEKSFTKDYYWEDVLIRNFKNLPPIYLYKLSKGIIFEFDTLNDIKEYDANIEEYGSEAIDFVKRAFNAKDKDIKDVKCIKEGMTNHSYHFLYKGERYLARIPGEGTSIFINRKSEKEVYDKLKNSGFIENIVFFDDNGYKISHYFNNARCLDIYNEKDLKECMKLYKNLHSLDIKVNAICDIIYKINEYMNIIKNNKIFNPYEDFDEIYKKVEEVEKFVINEDRPISLCHGDPNPGNVLYTDEGMKLIDFEYAGMADPISEISLFGIFVGFDIDKTMQLYNYYKESDLQNKYLPDENKERKLIISYMALGGFYSALWGIVRSNLSSDDCGDYGMKMYRTFKNCYKYFN